MSVANGSANGGALEAARSLTRGDLASQDDGRVRDRLLHAVAWSTLRVAFGGVGNGVDAGDQH